MSLTIIPKGIFDFKVVFSSNTFSYNNNDTYNFNLKIKYDLCVKV